MVTWNKTKIIATIGPASANRKMLRQILLAGADIIRINGAHAQVDEHRKTIHLIRSVGAKANFPAAILFDLPGPKIRVGSLKDETMRLKPGSDVTLICGKKDQVDEKIPIPMKQIAKGLKKGSKIFMNDGIIELSVTSIRGNEIDCRVRAGGELRSRKGVNLPLAKLDIPSLTTKDKKLLNMAVEEKVDYIGLSFVRSSLNVIALRKIVERKNPEIKIIAKIEKPEALEDIDNIIKAADAIMIARGDLGIEVPLHKVPLIQKKIHYKCHMAGKPSITATQMLESMVESKRPTRAEAADIANAVWEGSDAIMLSEETSIGKYPSTAVKEMLKIALEAEKIMPELPASLPGKGNAEFQAIAIAQAAYILAGTLNARAIVTPTRSGKTALFVSKQRPNAQILAPTESEKIARRMALYWGVRPLIMPHSATVDKLLISAEELSLKSGFIKKGDVIVITSGAHSTKDDITRLVEVRRAGE